MPAALYWRVNTTGTNNGTAVGIGEIEMKSAFGGADLCTGGTPSASSQFSASYVPANAFDNITTNAWHSGGNVLPGWVQYQFASAVDIIELTLRSRGDGTENGVAPRNFSLQHSNDGIAWTTLFTMTTGGSWATAEQRTFRFDIATSTAFELKQLRVNTQYGYLVTRGGLGFKANTQYGYLVTRGGLGVKVNTSYGYVVTNTPTTPDPGINEVRRYWRMLITRDQRILGGGNYYCNISELNYIGGYGVEDPYTGAVHSSTGFFAGYPESSAFDGNDASTWSGNMNVDPAVTPRWLQTDFGAASTRAVYSVSLVDFDNTSIPRNFRIQWSNDGITWVTFIQVAGLLPGVQGTTRTFTPLTHPPLAAEVNSKRAAQIIG